MAEKLDNSTFASIRSGWLYPWDEWLDGGVWKLVQGQDFETTVHGMRTQAYQAAHRRGLRVKTHIPEPSSLVIQAFENADTRSKT